MPADLRIGDLMTAPVVTVTEEMRLEDAAALMLQRQIGSLVVVASEASETPVGMITESDFDLQLEGIPGIGLARFRLPVVLGEAVLTDSAFEQAYARARALPVRDIMSAPCITVDEESTPMEAARLMLREGIRHLPVLRGDRLIGIVTGRSFLSLIADTADDPSAYQT